jgi:hypothetical protein
MNKILMISLLLLSSQIKAQELFLSVNKLDNFTKEVIRIAPYQSIAVRGVFEHQFININIRRNGLNTL